MFRGSSLCLCVLPALPVLACHFAPCPFCPSSLSVLRALVLGSAALLLRSSTAALTAASVSIALFVRQTRLLHRLPPMPLASYTSVDAAGKPLLGPEEAITFTADHTRLFLRTEKDEGEGTLFVTTKHLIWMNNERSAGYRMEYPYMLLHAVCRDTSAFPYPCLYAQLDDEVEEEAFQSASMRQTMPAAAASAASASAAGAGASSIDEDGADDDDEEAGGADEPISDLRFVPSNPAILDALYKAISACAALNPDSDLSDGEGDFMFNADEIRAGVRGQMGDAEEEGEEYGEGGDDGAAGYDGSAEARLARMLHLGSAGGMSAEEMAMYANDEDDEEAAEEEDESKADYKKGQPDDGAAQLASAAQQVKQSAAASAPKAAAHSAASSSAQKRERPEEDA